MTTRERVQRILWRADPGNWKFYEIETVVAYFTDYPPPQPTVFAEAHYAQAWALIIGFPEWELQQCATLPLTRDWAEAMTTGRACLLNAAKAGLSYLGGALAPRPPRRMPSLVKIAAFHRLASRHPHCLRCGYEPPYDTWDQAGGYLERAHMIDRVFYGLDGPQNLAPLCSWCHRQQPIFQEPREALAWFRLPLIFAEAGPP